MENENEVFLQFEKSDKGVVVYVNSGTTFDMLIGIAEAIQVLIEESGESKETILEDINKALEILEKEEEN